MMRTVVSSLVLLFARHSAYGQSTPKLEFEAASIKPSPPPAGGGVFRVGCSGGPGTNDPGLFVCENTSLPNLVIPAYRIALYQLSAPNWMMDTRFDVRVVVPEGATKQQFPTMLQNLLADRFNLAVHHQSREIQQYDLRVAKNGPKFKEAAPLVQKEAGGALNPLPSLKLDANGCPVLGPREGGVFTRGRAHIHFPEMTIEMLTGELSRQLRGPVTDLTGLPGKYDIDLCWSRDDGSRGVAPPPGGEPASTDSAPSGPTLMQALQEQLGLRLESKKGPVDFLVVDHAEKLPTEN